MDEMGCKKGFFSKNKGNFWKRQIFEKNRIFIFLQNTNNNAGEDYHFLHPLESSAYLSMFVRQRFCLAGEDVWLSQGATYDF